MRKNNQHLAIQKAIFKIPPDQREMFLLRYVENLNDREIARQLGIHPATVGRRMRRALFTLNESLGEILSDWAPSLVGPDLMNDFGEIVYDPTNGLMSRGDIVRPIAK